jgi:hypothetical protein
MLTPPFMVPRENCPWPAFVPVRGWWGTAVVAGAATRQGVWRTAVVWRARGDPKRGRMSAKVLGTASCGVSGLIGRRFLRARSGRGSGQFVKAGLPCVGVTCPGCSYGGARYRATDSRRGSGRVGWPPAGRWFFPRGLLPTFVRIVRQPSPARDMYGLSRNVMWTDHFRRLGNRTPCYRSD